MIVPASSLPFEFVVFIRRACCEVEMFLRISTGLSLYWDARRLIGETGKAEAFANRKRNYHAAYCKFDRQSRLGHGITSEM